MGFKILKAEKLKNLDIWDMACVKGSVFFFTLFLASVLPVLLSLDGIGISSLHCSLGSVRCSIGMGSNEKNRYGMLPVLVSFPHSGI